MRNVQGLVYSTIISKSISYKLLHIVTVHSYNYEYENFECRKNEKNLSDRTIHGALDKAYDLITNTNTCFAKW